MAGGLAVVSLCAVITMRGLRMAALLRGFRANLAVGLSLTLAVQSLIIMGGVLGMWPLTGITLPFLSYGGSSLLISFIIIGLLLNLSAGASR
jgi:cell division protein FtsW (lipid II flippase)